MQMCSEKAWTLQATAYSQGSLRSQDFANCHSLGFSVLILFIYVPGNGRVVLFCFVWKLLGRGKEVFFWKIRLSKGKQKNEISVHRISVTLWWITIAQWTSWLKVSFPVIFSHWWTWTWMNLCCLRHQRPFWGSLQGSLVNHKTLVLTPWPVQVIVSSSDNIYWAIAVH